MEKSKVERSQVTGEMVVTMPKLKPDYTLKRIKDRKDEEDKKQ